MMTMMFESMELNKLTDICSRYLFVNILINNEIRPREQIDVDTFVCVVE